MTTEITTRTIATDTYHGRELAIVETDYPASQYSPAWTRRSAGIDGRTFRCPTGTPEQVFTKLRKSIDTDEADAAILPRLVELVRALPSKQAPPAWSATVAPAVGDVVYVRAMGKYRRGLVTKLGRTRVEVAYTTASSGGRVYRVTTGPAGLRVDR
jgi:hypothetical protein